MTRPAGWKSPGYRDQDIKEYVQWFLEPFNRKYLPPEWRINHVLSGLFLQWRILDRTARDYITRKLREHMNHLLLRFVHCPPRSPNLNSHDQRRSPTPTEDRAPPDEEDCALWMRDRMVERLRREVATQDFLVSMALVREWVTTGEYPLPGAPGEISSFVRGFFHTTRSLEHQKIVIDDAMKTLEAKYLNKEDGLLKPQYDTSFPNERQMYVEVVEAIKASDPKIANQKQEERAKAKWR